MVNYSQLLIEDLRKWFGKGKSGGWDRYNTKGEKVGKCGDAEEGEPYVACLSNEKAAKLGKDGRASFVKRKRAAQKDAGDAKKGGEQSKGQKPTFVKTGVSERIIELKQILSKIIKEQFEDMKLSDFAQKRFGGAEKIANDAKEKGGPSILTYHHFVVKLPFYKEASEGKFDESKAISEYNLYMNSLHKLMQSPKPNPIEFQRIVGLLEVLGELIIKNKTTIVGEDWSKKYKDSIDCNNPKGFSQKAHCDSKKKNENMKLKLQNKLNLFLEKNIPTDPEKWSYAKSQAKQKFDVYPSAYANGWAAKKYKELGGGWKSEK
jgi:hypothetical protein